VSLFDDVLVAGSFFPLEPLLDELSDDEEAELSDDDLSLELDDEELRFEPDRLSVL
jgi:hypothetical protein